MRTLKARPPISRVPRLFAGALSVSRAAMALGATCALVLVMGVGQATAAPVIAATGAVDLCTGFSGCASAGYSNFGYASVYTQSFWGQDSGHNCTNYVAYRFTAAGVGKPSWLGIGNAIDWGTWAPAAIVNQTPTPGAIAWWGPGSAYAVYGGHVSIVQQVNSNGSFIDSDDNYGGDFHWREYTPGGTEWPTAFIHLDDAALSGAPTIRTSSLPAVMVGQPYSAALSATGGAAPYRWTIAGGSLPPGLSLSGSGAVSGVPFSNGAYSFTAKVTGSNGASSAGTVSVAVEPGGNLLQHASVWGRNTGGWQEPPASSSNVVNMAAYGVSGNSLPEGHNYLETNTNQAGGSIIQDIPATLSPGQSYTFSAWMRVHSANPRKRAKVCVVLWGLGSPSQNGQTCRTLTTKWRFISAPYDIAASGEYALRAQVYELTTGVNIDLDGAQLSS